MGAFDVNSETELWGNSKDRLRKFLKDRKREDGYNAQRGKQRATTIPNVSTTKTARPSSATGFKSQPKELKEDDDNEDEDNTTRKVLFPTVSREQIIGEGDTINFDAQSRRFIVGALKKHGVDIQVYFDGVINGPHCFTFVETMVSGSSCLSRRK